MYKLFLSVLLFFLLGCFNQSQDKHENEASESKSLQLNDGKKWKLDETTRTNIAAIKSILADSSTENLSTLAVNLTKHTDKLVSECKMEGPDHAALHIWLEQWLEHLRDIKTSGTDQQGAVRALKQDATEFDNYFE